MGKLFRYQTLVFIGLFVGYACYTYNRKSVSYALPKLMEEGLQKNDAGLIISGSYLAYAISKFLGGVLSDRVSARVLFATGLVVSGLATVLFAAFPPTAVGLLTACWFLNGLAQGCGWPACSKIILQWFAPDQLGTWWSLLSASSNISGTLSPFLSAALILSYGWKISLLVAGAVSVVWGVCSLLALVDSPQDVGLPGFKPAAKSTNSGSQKDTAEDGTAKELLRSPFLWLVAGSYLAVSLAKSSAVDWGQLFLLEDLGHSQYVGSTFNSSLELGGFFGGIIAGLLTDWALKTHKPVPGVHSTPRMKVAIFMMAVASVCFHCLYFVVNSQSSVILISVVGAILGACLYGPIAIFGIVASECCPKNLSGTSHAIVCLAANVGSIISGLPFSYVAKAYNWAAIFLILEMVTGACALAMLVFRNLDCRMVRPKKD